MDGSGSVIVNLLLGIISGFLGVQFFYYGVKAVRRKEFIFFPFYVLFGAYHFYDDTLFKKGYPTVKGWWGVVIGSFVVLVSVPLIWFAWQFLNEAGVGILKDLNRP